MPATLPNFLIVGAMKCGTTSLAKLLGAHPQVYMAPTKELYFFERDSLWARGADWYAAQFEHAGDAAAIGEATPNYMYLQSSVERIAATLPGARVIACLRDPVERAHSHYLHWVEAEARERRTFAQAVEDELAAGAPERRDDPDGDPPYFGYLARGRYLPQLQRLADAVGRERLHVVLLDDLRSDPGGVYREVCRFLAIDETFEPPDVGTKLNVYHEYRPAWLWKWMVRHRVFERLPRRVTSYLVLGVMRRPAPVPAVEPAVRRRLAEHFAPANAALAEWLGRELPAWGRSPVRG